MILPSNSLLLVSNISNSRAFLPFFVISVCLPFLPLRSDSIFVCVHFMFPCPFPAVVFYFLLPSYFLPFHSGGRHLHVFAFWWRSLHFQHFCIPLAHMRCSVIWLLQTHVWAFVISYRMPDIWATMGSSSGTLLPRRHAVWTGRIVGKTGIFVLLWV